MGCLSEVKDNLVVGAAKDETQEYSCGNMMKDISKAYIFSVSYSFAFFTPESLK